MLATARRHQTGMAHVESLLEEMKNDGMEIGEHASGEVSTASEQNFSSN